MELVLQQLLGVIEHMTGQSKRLVDLARRQRQAVINEQVREVGEIVIEQEGEMETFRQLDRERESLMQELCGQLAIPEKEMTSSCLVQRLPAHWSNHYRFQIDKLRIQVEEVKKEHEINRRLLQRSQQFVSWLLNYIVTPECPGTVYDRQGEQVQPAYYHIINQRW